jgi:hypothetical protein
MTDRRNSDGSFKKGNIPWNKGKHCEYEGSKRTQFKKGMKPFSWKPVGSITKRGDGYTYIKVSDNPSKWVLYQRYLYEKAHKYKVSKSEMVLFLDGNKNNFGIDNLVKVSRAENGIINNQGLQTKGNKELSRTGVLIAKIKVKISKRGEAND